MFVSSATLPNAVLYLLLLFMETLGQGGDLTADYLQDGRPFSRVGIALERGTTDTYRIAAYPYAEGADESSHESLAPFTVARIEQSRLVSHNYLLYGSGSTEPLVISLAPVLSEMLAPGDAVVRSIPVDASQAVVSGEGDLDIGSTLHILRRPGVRLLSAPEVGVLLVVSEE